MKKKYLILIPILFPVLIVFMLSAKRTVDNDNKEKYGGHGFEYMHGYSSSDFTGYHVYDGEKLYSLDHEASFQIENEEDMPVLDGAEACYPVYCAIAKAVYKDIGDIEKNYHDQAEKFWEKARNEKTPYDYKLGRIYETNGKIITFTNTSEAYYRLIDRSVDMVFGARPSSYHKDYAVHHREQIVTTPIGKEAFVFFVEEDNPIEDLTSEEIRAIYHGDIKNWKELGGPDQKIIAFQRPENSGSQVMMRWFMKDVELQEPKTYEYASGMGGVVKEVAQYHNEAGAIGYSFRYFLSEFHQEEHIRILTVDGVEPSIENIKNGSYPATVDLVCATLVSNENPNVKNLLDFLLSEDGQEIIEGSGYARLSDTNVKSTIENEIDDTVPMEYRINDEDPWILKLYKYGDDYYDVVFELYNSSVYYKGNFITYNEDTDFFQNYGTNGAVTFDNSFEQFFDYDREKDTYTVKRVELLETERTYDLPSSGSVFTKYG
jgi:ABC-type phosphate transport system substrate-binding protein